MGRTTLAMALAAATLVGCRHFHHEEPDLAVAESPSSPSAADVSAPSTGSVASSGSPRASGSHAPLGSSSSSVHSSAPGLSPLTHPTNAMQERRAAQMLTAAYQRLSGLTAFGALPDAGGAFPPEVYEHALAVAKDAYRRGVDAYTRGFYDRAATLADAAAAAGEGLAEALIAGATAPTDLPPPPRFHGDTGPASAQVTKAMAVKRAQERAVMPEAVPFLGPAGTLLGAAETAVKAREYERATRLASAAEALLKADEGLLDINVAPSAAERSARAPDERSARTASLGDTPLPKTQGGATVRSAGKGFPAGSTVVASTVVGSPAGTAAPAPVPSPKSVTSSRPKNQGGTTVAQITPTAVPRIGGSVVRSHSSASYASASPSLPSPSPSARAPHLSDYPSEPKVAQAAYPSEPKVAQAAYPSATKSGQAAYPSAPKSGQANAASSAAPLAPTTEWPNSTASTPAAKPGTADRDGRAAVATPPLDPVGGF